MPATSPPPGWQAILAKSVRSPAELCQLLGLQHPLAAEAQRAAGDWPLLVPRPYLARIRPGDPADPLLRQVLPQAAELEAVAGYTADPLGEAAACCGAGLLRKYQGRILMVASPACGIHCRFCFRRHFPYGPGEGRDTTVGGDSSRRLPGEIPGIRRLESPPTAFSQVLAAALREIAADPSIHEVILSGGDPLMLPDDELAELAEQLAAIPHVRRLRIHTRLPVVIPERVTDGLISGLRGSRLSAVMVVHVNHPAEIDQRVADALGRLVDAGVPLLSQSVLLRGLNDRADVLCELFERLVDLRVIPYYLHQLDPVAGAAHFEVPVTTGVAILSELRARLPGYAVPRYVREVPGGNSKKVLA